MEAVKPSTEIVVQVEPGFTPVDGDAFDAVVAALDFAEIPAALFQRKQTTSNKLVSQFMQELQAAPNALEEIGKIHGYLTLVDIVCLIQALNEESQMDWSPLKSALVDIVGNLPSGDKWLTYINMKS